MKGWGKDFPHAGGAASPAPHSSGEFPATPPCRHSPGAVRRKRDCSKRQTRFSCAAVATVGPVLAIRSPLLPPGFAAGRSDRRLSGGVPLSRERSATTPFRHSAPHGTVSLSSARDSSLRPSRPCHCLRLNTKRRFRFSLVSRIRHPTADETVAMLKRINSRGTSAYAVVSGSTGNSCLRNPIFFSTQPNPCANAT